MRNLQLVRSAENTENRASWIEEFLLAYICWLAPNHLQYWPSNFSLCSEHFKQCYLFQIQLHGKGNWCVRTIFHQKKRTLAPWETKGLQNQMKCDCEVQAGSQDLCVPVSTDFMCCAKLFSLSSSLQAEIKAKRKNMHHGLKELQM